MNPKTRTLYITALCAAALTGFSARADIVWTGAADNNFWNAANWAGGAPVPGGLPTLANIIMNGAVGVTGAGNALNLGDGYSLFMTNSTLTFTDGNGFGGTAGGVPSTAWLDNSSVTIQYIATGFDLFAVNGSSLSLKGTGRAINSNADTAGVYLSPYTTVTFLNGSADPAGNSPLTPTDRSNGLAVFNSWYAQSYTADKLSGSLDYFQVTGLDLTPFAVSAGGDGVNQGSFTITAVPEPGALALTGVGALLVLLRRKATSFAESVVISTNSPNKP